ncbi:hypothetical protein K439DRAFT_1661401 [Ramaria rubella]|nr:hypothetical protein K439DRAFT_1661401 [Ramaria rubella]
MARWLTCRSSPVVAVLIAVNITTLLLFFYRGESNTLWIFNDVTKQHEEPRPVAPVTVTVTAVTTATATVETSRQSASSDSSKPFRHRFCDVCGPQDTMCTLYGEHNLARSRVYEGANSRLRRVIKDALAGKPIKIGVLGGSVTKGNGLLRNHVENWTVRFFEGWKALFPKSKATLVNGAVPATGSDYLSMCFGEHIDDVDLVVVELLINDQRLESEALAYEWLLRGVLGLPRSPAVVNLHTIGLSFDYISTGGDLHTPIAEYYDAPIISMRNMLVHHVLNNPHLDEYYFNKLPNGEPDWRHVNAKGHKVMADLLTAYTQRQICAIERDNTQTTTYITDGTLPGTDGLDTIPRLRLFQKYDRESVTGPIKPMCQSIRTEKHPLSPVEANGWEQWAHVGRLEKKYLVARQPGATIKLKVVVGVMYDLSAEQDLRPGRRVVLA